MSATAVFLTDLSLSHVRLHVCLIYVFVLISNWICTDFCVESVDICLSGSASNGKNELLPANMHFFAFIFAGFAVFFFQNSDIFFGPISFSKMLNSIFRRLIEWGPDCPAMFLHAGHSAQGSPGPLVSSSRPVNLLQSYN